LRRPQCPRQSPLARLALASRLGAAHVINAREQDPVEGLQDLTAGRGIDRTPVLKMADPTS
jgi:NADPH:quinone reductase-like Zn-dependent oxidoreductase